MKFNGILKQKNFKEIATLLKCMNFTNLLHFYLTFETLLLNGMLLNKKTKSYIIIDVKWILFLNWIKLNVEHLYS
jgi:hypothetical protein